MNKIDKNIEHENYSTAKRSLDSVSFDKLELNDVKYILEKANKLVIGDFLSDYQSFSTEMLDYIEGYINKNLNHPNRLFVSDLINYASDWGLNISYNKCIDFVTITGKDNDFVMLASIDYIFENLKMHYLDKIFNVFNQVLYGGIDYNHSCKIKVAFYLYRISHNSKYFMVLKEFMKDGDSLDREILKNIMDAFYNNEDYFDDYRKVIELI